MQVLAVEEVGRLAAAKNVFARTVLVHLTLVTALSSQPTVGEIVSGKERE